MWCEGREKNIAEGDHEVGGEEKFEQNKKDYNLGNACGNDDVVYGHGVRGTNSNIVGRRQYEWQGVEYDLVNDGGVSLQKVRWLHVAHRK